MALRKSQTKPDTSDDENLVDSQQTSFDMLTTAREMVEAVCASYDQRPINSL